VADPLAQRKHPHADAVYRIIETPDRAYGVEVAIPDSSPAVVTSFATEDAAEAWIATHKRQVESGPLKRTKTNQGTGKLTTGVPAGSGMIAELEIYRAANILLKEYGAEDAGFMAAKSTIAMIEVGDLDGLRTWKAILRAVLELRRNRNLGS
jgi:hypothetical protein